MIPKKIHYCWFGNKDIPKIFDKCYKSWKKYCPDYEIILWNEKNYDVSSNRYTQEAYDQKRFAFVSDYVRWDVLYNYGGIYLDIDVEIVKPLDQLLNNELFIGFESDLYIASGLITGAIQNHHVTKVILNKYDLISQNKIKKYQPFITPCPVIETDTFKELGLVKDNGTIQHISDMSFYPKKYFANRNQARLPQKCDLSYTIHHYAGSWCEKKQSRKFYNFIKRCIYFTLGNNSSFLVNLKRKALSLFK